MSIHSERIGDGELTGGVDASAWAERQAAENERLRGKQHAAPLAVRLSPEYQRVLGEACTAGTMSGQYGTQLAEMLRIRNLWSDLADKESLPESVREFYKLAAASLGPVINKILGSRDKQKSLRDAAHAELIRLEREYLATLPAAPLAGALHESEKS